MLSPGAAALPPRDIESDEDYIEAVDHPFPQPSRSSSRPKKRRVRWHGSEEETSDTDGDPVSRIYVPNTQPDFDVVIDQVRTVLYVVCCGVPTVCVGMGWYTLCTYICMVVCAGLDIGSLRCLAPTHAFLTCTCSG